MTAILDVVLTFCPTMRCAPKKRKLLMPVYNIVSALKLHLSLPGKGLIAFLEPGFPSFLGNAWYNMVYEQKKD